MSHVYHLLMLVTWTTNPDVSTNPTPGSAQGDRTKEGSSGRQKHCLLCAHCGPFVAVSLSLVSFSNSGFSYTAFGWVTFNQGPQDSHMWGLGGISGHHSSSLLCCSQVPSTGHHSVFMAPHKGLLSNFLSFSALVTPLSRGWFCHLGCCSKVRLWIP